MQVFRHGRLLFDRSPVQTARLVEQTLGRWFDEAPLRRIIDDAVRRRLGVERAS